MAAHSWAHVILKRTLQSSNFQWLSGTCLYLCGVLIFHMSCKDFHIDLDRTAHNLKKLSMWKIIRACPHRNFQIGGEHNSVLPIAFYIIGNKMKPRLFKNVPLLCDSSPVEDVGKYQEILKAAELGQCWAPLKISIKSVAQPQCRQRTSASNFKADVLSILCGFFYC